jgi:hypothetical protein
MAKFRFHWSPQASDNLSGDPDQFRPNRRAAQSALPDEFAVIDPVFVESDRADIVFHSRQRRCGRTVR